MLDMSPHSDCPGLACSDTQLTSGQLSVRYAGEAISETRLISDFHAIRRATRKQSIRSSLLQCAEPQRGNAPLVMRRFPVIAPGRRRLLPGVYVGVTIGWPDSSVSAGKTIGLVVTDPTVGF